MTPAAIILLAVQAACVITSVIILGIAARQRKTVARCNRFPRAAGRWRFATGKPCVERTPRGRKGNGELVPDSGTNSKLHILQSAGIAQQ